MKRKYDIIIIGGGPCGLAAAIELKKKGFSELVIEKGGVTESINNYPKNMSFFSTAQNISIGGIPFPSTKVKPSRREALQYYRKVSLFYELNMQLYTEVEDIKKDNDGFVVLTKDQKQFYSNYVIIATGYFDIPRKLDITGEDLPHVTHYYNEPYPYSFTDVVIVGGGNSGIEAALELYRHDANVILVHRDESFKPTAKYWLLPDIKNRVKEGNIGVKFNSKVEKIEKDKLKIDQGGNKEELKADFVLLLTGYLPDIPFLNKAGVKIKDKEEFRAEVNQETFETNVSGLFLCGTVMAGLRTESIFIENGREHAKVIAEVIDERESGLD
ncbi:MAG: YpdA family putative bacillithiol disulfide reductase [Flavobacteriales bacterium]